jgi:hydroxymethylpyrimidine/phosphomethylpyrimidine kinase
MNEIKKVLTIAGSDSSGGAGIQADIKTIAAHKMYAMSAVTSLTAQNTTGVYAILDAPPEFVAKELDAIFTDIRPDAVKIGMVSQPGIIRAIAAKLREYEAKNIVADPVMIASSGSRLLSPDAMNALREELLPLADIITPNLPEAAVLTGHSIKDKQDMLRAAQEISALLKSAVLIKGGHLEDTADDLLYTNGKVCWFHGEKIPNPNTHGTGCTLSSAIACNLAAGCTLPEAVQNAKEYLTGALRFGLDLGHGSGPLYHMYRIQ